VLRFLFILFLIFMCEGLPADLPPCQLKNLCRLYSFPLGMALDTEKLKFNESYWKLALSEFNSFTPERILKPSFIQPQPDKYNFTEIDELMRFCKERHIRLHGHTLIWHRDIPLWMQRRKGSPADILSMMQQHIKTVVEHCEGKIAAWDVVNEAFNDDGSYRENLWLNKIGPAYLAEAFKTAAAADASALLF